jgi:hypothetical protein
MRVKKYKTSLHRIAFYNVEEKKKRERYNICQTILGTKELHTLQRGGGNTMVGFPITELKSTNKYTVYKP